MPAHQSARWPFTPAEDAIIYAGQKSMLTYQTISEYLPERTKTQVRYRWTKFLREGGAPWTEAEDQILYAMSEDELDWEKAAEKMKGRTAADCEERYFALGKNEAATWSADDHFRLGQLRAAGTSWDDIAQSLSDHTAPECRGHWYNYIWDGRARFEEYLGEVNWGKSTEDKGVGSGADNAVEERDEQNAAGVEETGIQAGRAYALPFVDVPLDAARLVASVDFGRNRSFM